MFGEGERGETAIVKKLGKAFVYLLGIILVSMLLMVVFREYLKHYNFFEAEKNYRKSKKDEEERPEKEKGE